MQTLEEKSADIIAMLEGLKLEAYQDSGGVWTIGLGHTGSLKVIGINTNVCKEIVISYQQAITLFKNDVKPLFDYVKNFKFTSLISTTQQTGWVSFGYNAGLEALKNRIDKPESILDCVHDRHGNKIDNLVRRRRFEYALIVG